MKVLVIGARMGSLGMHIADYAAELGMQVVTAGISGENYYYHVVDSTAQDFLHMLQPDHIVYTAGINEPGWDYDRHFAVNCTGAMKLLGAWRTVQSELAQVVPVDPRRFNHYVAISSNSAHIARTNSGPYCASKAALSMAIRVAARELARENSQTIAYGYEPGLLAGTPMTTRTAARLGGPEDPFGPVLHRMPGVDGRGLDPVYLAGMVVRNLFSAGRQLNGCLLRIDAGEQ